jgi:multidrug efflux pump subunit AcrA (membrane-fusion protein)
VYASGTIKSKNQYQVFATVNGLLVEIFVKEGDTVKKGEAVLRIAGEAQRLSRENAELAARFNALSVNQGKLNEAKAFAELAKNKFTNDSLLFVRQKNLWEQKIGTQLELEQRELALNNSKTAYVSALIKYEDLKRQLAFTASQTQKNLLISDKQESDYTVRSELDGIVYNISKEKGEMVTPQNPLAVIGSANAFILEMQVDEYDITKIKKGLPVLVSLDSHKDKFFEATITRINPLMNERSKTFLVEAEFVKQPELIYPNVSFEANIVLARKEKVLLIPRNYLLNDSAVVKANGDTLVVKTGLKDYQKVEIISGLTVEDEIKKP